MSQFNFRINLKSITFFKTLFSIIPEKIRRKYVIEIINKFLFGNFYCTRRYPVISCLQRRLRNNVQHKYILLEIYIDVAKFEKSTHLGILFH